MFQAGIGTITIWIPWRYMVFLVVFKHLKFRCLGKTLGIGAQIFAELFICELRTVLLDRQSALDKQLICVNCWNVCWIQLDLSIGYIYIYSIIHLYIYTNLYIYLYTILYVLFGVSVTCLTGDFLKNERPCRSEPNLRPSTPSAPGLLRFYFCLWKCN